MGKKFKYYFNWRQYSLLIIAIVLLVISVLASSGPSIEDLLAVDYTPLPGDDWEVSTPAEHGLDPMLVAELYYNAAELETIYSLLVIKNSYLIAEDYLEFMRKKNIDTLVLGCTHYPPLKYHQINFFIRIDK